MPSKRKILEAITRDGLLALASRFEIGGLSAHNRAKIIDALMATGSLSAEAVLDTFSRDDLKAVCRKLRLDDTGREKHLLTERLLSREGNAVEGDRAAATKGTAMAKKVANAGGNGIGKIEDYRHTDAKRKNNPPAHIAAEGTIPVMAKIEYSYSPRRPPVLRFDSTADADLTLELLSEATQRKLTPSEVRQLSDALRTQQPWLEWAGKRESQKTGFAVDPVALHIHERISTEAILKVAARQDIERSLFADPAQEYHEAVQFYKHDIDWTNRLILGDSLQVMASLARREDLAGRVQMIYVDPPYGIRFGSNFQSEVGRREVKDRDADLTRELEMVKAYRDTWHLGIHSYLSYLRDRLIVAKELLADTGSIFVQISDENIHRVRDLLDEVFGSDNFCGLIAFKTTGGQSTSLLATSTDFLLWYARDRDQGAKKFHQPTTPKVGGEEASGQYVLLESPEGKIEPMTVEQLDGRDAIPNGHRILAHDTLYSQGAPSDPLDAEFKWRGQVFRCPPNTHWKPGAKTGGMQRLAGAERLMLLGNTPRYKRFVEDYPVYELDNVWSDTGRSGFAGKKTYVVETSTKVVERCMLMTTDPGDLVLDPTCGSGTTAYVAEQWGRRWITIDTSRVAVAITRQRLLTAKFDYFQMRDEKKGVAGGFRYKSITHVTLKSIAQNLNLDPIFAKHEPILEACLAACNDELLPVTPELRSRLELKLLQKQRAAGRRAISDAERRRWQLPQSGEKWDHRQVPFDCDPDWPKGLREAVAAYRKAWRAKMEAVNACIAANSKHEELVDQPEVVRGLVRVSGPLTVEAVQPPELSLGDSLETLSPISGEPDSLDTFAPASTVRTVEAKREFEVQNVEAYLDEMAKLLRLDGVRFPDNKQRNFSRLQRIRGTEGGIQAEGRWVNKGDIDSDPEGPVSVAVAFGPQYGPVTAKQVEQLIRSASRRGYDDLVVAGFSFDGPAQAIIQGDQHPNLRIHIAHIRPDVNPGMAGLLKEQPGSQLFTVFGQPRTRIVGPDRQGEYTVYMEGVDIYDPVTNTIRSTEDQKVAAWFLDGDYDGRTFCITQAFFPDKSAWEKLSNALDGVVDPDRFEALSGSTSLPFPLGKHKTVAVKVIDPRGNEVMQVHHLG